MRIRCGPLKKVRVHRLNFSRGSSIVGLSHYCRCRIADCLASPLAGSGRTDGVVAEPTEVMKQSSDPQSRLEISRCAIRPACMGVGLLTCIGYGFRSAVGHAGKVFFACPDGGSLPIDRPNFVAINQHVVGE
ncbi:MAG: hypothetical protein JWM57_3817 [Phycisphaerales bacterium]|nr:hypothetical protein [Phycisphaerales bacterium]